MAGGDVNMSQWVGQRYDAVAAFPPAPTPWDAALGEPTYISQWPKDKTKRISPTLRWDVDEFFRPMHSRLFGFIGYGVNDPAIGLGFDHVEYFVLDLSEVNGTLLRGSTPISAYNSRVLVEIERFDSLPGVPFPVVRARRVVNAAGQGEVTQDALFGFSDYSYLGPDPSQLAKIPIGLSPEVGKPFPYVWLWYQGLAECYPADSFQEAEARQMSNELAGILINPVPSQSIAGGQDIEFSNVIREAGGLWFDPAQPSPKTQIVVPSPFNYIRFVGKIKTGNSSTNQVTVAMTINGSRELPLRVAQQTNPGGAATTVDIEAVSPHWIAVSPGDIIGMWCSQNGGSISPTLERNWVSVQGAFFI